MQLMWRFHSEPVDIDDSLWRDYYVDKEASHPLNPETLWVMEASASCCFKEAIKILPGDHSVFSTTIIKNGRLWTLRSARSSGGQLINFDADRITTQLQGQWTSINYITACQERPEHDSVKASHKCIQTYNYRDRTETMQKVHTARRYTYAGYSCLNYPE